MSPRVTLLLLPSLALAVACSGNPGGNDGGAGGGTAAGGGGGGAGGGAGGGTGGGAADGGCTHLTVKNYLSWCDVSVGAAAASSAASTTVCVAPGTVALSAAPLAGFQLGSTPWHHTNGDTGSGEAGTVSGGHSSAAVTVGGTSVCVWVCCEFTGGGGCPATDQCP